MGGRNDIDSIQFVSKRYQIDIVSTTYFSLGVLSVRVRASAIMLSAPLLGPCKNFCLTNGIIQCRMGHATLIWAEIRVHGIAGMKGCAHRVKAGIERKRLRNSKVWNSDFRVNKLALLAGDPKIERLRRFTGRMRQLGLTCQRTRLPSE